MDGNFYNTFDLRMPRADTLIWLDYPRRTCLRRVLLRSFKDYGRNRSDLAEGCPEQFDVEFYRFVWDFPAKYRPYIVDGIERFGGHLCVSQFRQDRDADDFLATLGAP
jgi:adenylate kinase family enzyme